LILWSMELATSSGFLNSSIKVGILKFYLFECIYKDGDYMDLRWVLSSSFLLDFVWKHDLTWLKSCFFKFKKKLLIFVYIFILFWYADLKNNFFKKKIILIHFYVKSILNRNHYHNPKQTRSCNITSRVEGIILFPSRFDTKYK
jgi:hypothetical protein